MDERRVAHPVPASDLDARGPRGYQVAHRVVRSFVDYAGIFGAWLLSGAGYTVDSQKDRKGHLYSSYSKRNLSYCRPVKSGQREAAFAFPGVRSALRVVANPVFVGDGQGSTVEESIARLRATAWKSRRQSGRQNCCMWPPLCRAGTAGCTRGSVASCSSQPRQRRLDQSAGESDGTSRCERRHIDSAHPAVEHHLDPPAIVGHSGEPPAHPRPEFDRWPRSRRLPVGGRLRTPSAGAVRSEHTLRGSSGYPRVTFPSSPVPRHRLEGRHPPRLLVPYCSAERVWTGGTRGHPIRGVSLSVPPRPGDMSPFCLPHVPLSPSGATTQTLSSQTPICLSPRSLPRTRFQAFLNVPSWSRAVKPPFWQ